MNLLLGSLLAVVGLVWFCAAIFDWEWMIMARNNRLLVWVLGRQGTRIFFAIGGLAFIVGGILYVTGQI